MTDKYSKLKKNIKDDKEFDELIKEEEQQVEEEKRLKDRDDEIRWNK